MTDVQDTVQRILDRAVADNRESGVQVCAYHHGRLIVDAWAAPRSRRFDGDALVPVFSTGKGIAATAIHRLVERGVLDYDAPIARWWPEFAAAGKAGVTLRMAMDHSAGLAQLHEDGRIEDLCDWGGMCWRIAAAAPVHEPGQRKHYHAITMGWILGETARRADGRGFARIVAEECFAPIGVADWRFGIADADLPRVVCAETAPAARPGTPPSQPSTAPPVSDPVAERAIPWWVRPLEDFINRDDIRRACIPASNGFASARTMARHYAALLGAGVDGVRLVSERTVEAASIQSAIPGRWGLGYGLSGPESAPGAVIGHGGYGGSTAFADRRYGLAVGATRARMGAGSVLGEAIQAIRDALGAH